VGEQVPPRHRRRERRRHRPAAAAPPASGGVSGEYPSPPASAPVGDGPAGRAAGDDWGTAGAGAGTGAKGRGTRRGSDAERSLRGIVGAGPSQVGVSGAMRARDAARPTAGDLAAADRDLVIIRRNYVPPDADSPTDPPSA
jgi:hypothetical protein